LILYLDTSSLVKLYVAETHSSLVRGWTEEAEIIATCRVAFPELISALNRRFRIGDLAKEDYALLMRTITGDWRHFAILDFDEIEAGRLAEAHGLRGMDAIHISAAKLLKVSEDAPSVAFSSFDEKLNRAAIAEKLSILLPK
jgi:predicted nucleic acid-binding protein